MPETDKPEPAGITSDLTDLTGVPLTEVADTLTGEEATETLRRVAPTDGTQLLVAASFNSAI